MNSSKKGWTISIFIWIVTGILLLLILGTVFLFMYLRASLVPDEKEMEKATEQAEQYLQTKYPEMKYQISHISYNSEEQSGNYDYAAMVIDIETQKSFMVYENRITGKMEDDISIQEEEEFLKQVKPKIVSYINQKFGETNEISLTASYEVGGIPSLNIGLNNNKEELSEEMFLSFINYLQNELKIEHAYVSIQYDNGNELWDTSY
ncbi:hypothetical protein PGH26_00090 [Sporosarcina jeotgali]|uniref:YfjL-like N-terminal domain-containing protein n=1 Tax=Sporosarcina jeotgali TaxID=3020056 RepID=A0ABZ0KVD3_9BACL|nr:hypothetical protein [Sporosarcina sp. B2O-1]WOV84382.1 hypothetical protein PGH26_00090 [Sporosarcina sp. B2O-1]